MNTGKSFDRPLSWNALNITARYVYDARGIQSNIQACSEFGLSNYQLKVKRWLLNFACLGHIALLYSRINLSTYQLHTRMLYQRLRWLETETYCSPDVLYWAVLWTVSLQKYSLFTFVFGLFEYIYLTKNKFCVCLCSLSRLF